MVTNMRELLGSLNIGQSRVSLFHVDGKGVQVVVSKPGKLLVEGYYPDLEEVLMALFVETHKPNKVSSRGRAYFLATDFDAFIFKYFPSLKASEIRRKAGDKGLTLVPRSKRDARGGTGTASSRLRSTARPAALECRHPG